MKIDFMNWVWSAYSNVKDLLENNENGNVDQSPPKLPGHKHLQIWNGSIPMLSGEGGTAAIGEQISNICTYEERTSPKMQL